MYINKSLPRNFSFVLAAISLLFSICNVQAGEITVNIESPTDGGTYSGIANLRGWAISTVGIAKIELYFDDTYKTDIPMGASRGDVGSAFPQHPDSSASGFSMAFNYGLKSFPFKITYKIIDNDGTTVIIDRNVTPIKFGDDSFLTQDAVIDYSSATFITSSNAIQITGMRVNGVSYNATLAWDNESQQLQFTSIN